MQIVDAQIHTWGQGLPSNAAHIQVTSYTPAEAITGMDEAGVNAAVIHPPTWDPQSVEMAMQAVTDYPGRFAIIGAVDLSTPEESAAAMATWRSTPGMLGLRCMFLSGDGRTRLEAGELDWFWTAAQEHGIPVTALATDVLTILGDVAVKYTGLRLTIDHLGGRGGNTTLKDHEAMVHMPELIELAQHPNIAVKATGAPGYSTEPYPHPIMLDYLRRIFDAFGPDRMFWGTDITKMPISWRQCVTQFSEELDWLSGEDLEKVMGSAVCDWWGWDRTA